MESTPVAPLRGATVERRRSVSQRAALATLVVSLLVVMLSNGATVVRDVNRQHRLEQQGIATAIRVTNCIGNLGGSGSTGAGYHCSGRYVVRGQALTEVIVGQSDFLSPGATVAGVVDPTNTHFVVAVAAVSSLGTSPVALWPTLVSILILGSVLTRRRRR